MKPIIIKPTDNIDILVEFLKEGRLVAFPTETVYGLGVNALNRDGIERIYEIKGRDREKALSLHIGTIKNLENYIEMTPFILKIILQLLPGPINIIVKKKDTIPRWIGKGDTIGIRFPSLQITQRLLRYAEVPIVATSANISGGTEPRSSRDVIEMLGNRIDGILDGGVVPIGKPSTVVNISSGNIEVLREGPVDRKTIEAIIKEIYMREDMEVK
jgi:L-threonylcarbamoyladenylate synthase